MKTTNEYYLGIIKAQKQQIDDLIEERDILKRSLKQQNKAIAELWETYLAEDKPCTTA